MDRSRLSSVHGLSVPSVVTRAVSGETSAWIPLPSGSITVRHTPLTARLSPGRSSGARAVVTRRRVPSRCCVTLATSPIDSIRPVNITLDQHVVSNRLGAVILQPGDRAVGQSQPVHTAFAQCLGGNK